MFTSDDDDFPVKCPKCLQEWHEKIARLKTGEIRCPDIACQILIGIRPELVHRALTDARRDPRRYYSQFDRLRMPD